MLFQTALFLAFLGGVLAVDAVLWRRRRARHAFLLAASCLFYMAWSVELIGLLAFSTALDFWAGGALHRARGQRRRRAILLASLAGNLGLLGLFKYHDFFAHSANGLFAWLGIGVELPLLRLALPVGISFYTFQTLSYTLDIYRGRLAPCASLVDFALFVAFFPQLVAGPIVRASEFLPQLERPPGPDAATAREGVYLFLKGFTKKVLFADVLATFLVDPVFKRPAGYGGLWILLAILGFKFQIYGDFSGYSDMAIGCGKLLGFELPVNFRSPYKATSIRDYWSRWHITLGSWFRDFLFVPLGGSRAGEWRAARNVVLTMAVVGLWHGASWTFVIWGAYYGVLMAIERAWALRRPARAGGGDWRRYAKMAFVFQLTAFANLVFRAPDLPRLGTMLANLGAPTSGQSVAPWVALAFAAAVATHFAPERAKSRVAERFAALPALAQGATAALLLGAGSVALEHTNPFYYFQF